jgi:NAD(P)-dependent dehydrogenase (short-subunit alcohol dehydrogenase family)
MLRRNTGCIVNVGSVVAQNGAAGQSIYAATKAGLEGFTQSLAREVGPKGVRVNVVAPGFTRTAMTADLPAARVDEVLSMIPLQRFADPEDIADAVMYLTRAKYVTGTVLTVDGGLSC